MKMELSNSEWKLMKKLWESAPATITQLTAALREETGWTKHTVISMLSRLEAKGAVAYDEGAKAKAYRPLLREEDAAQAETRSFLNKVYAGRLGLMVNAMLDSRALTDEDVEELAAILNRAREGKE